MEVGFVRMQEKALNVLGLGAYIPVYLVTIYIFSVFALKLQRTNDIVSNVVIYELSTQKGFVSHHPKTAI